MDIQHRCTAVIEEGKGYQTTLIIGVDIPRAKLLEHMLVMGTGRKRTKSDLSKFANVPTALWDTVTYYGMSFDSSTGEVRGVRETNELETHQAFKRNEDFYRDGFAFVEETFDRDANNAIEIGRKRLAVYAAAYLHMSKIDAEKAKKFMTFFLLKDSNPLEKGNPVDAVRSHLESQFKTQFRDKTRPAIVRNKLLRAFEYFISKEKSKSRWDFTTQLTIFKDNNEDSTKVARKAKTANA